MYGRDLSRPIRNGSKHPIIFCEEIIEIKTNVQCHNVHICPKALFLSRYSSY